MIHFKFSDKDKRYLFLTFDTPEDHKNLKALKKHINLTDPICYLPTFTGIPFTQDFLFEYLNQNGTLVYYCAIGLWQPIYKFFKDNNIPYDGLDPKRFKRELKHTFEEFKAIVDSWNLKYPPRPYQYECAYKILQWNQSLSSLATRAGKTLLAYIVFRYAMEYLGVKKILMIVPSISLVTQGYDDFKEYGEFFNTECVWGGGKLVESSNLTIGTFQSLIKFIDRKDKKYNPDFFNGYDLVFVDETHRATAAQMKNIISQPFMKDVKVAFGMSGTIPKEGTIDRYCLHSLLGAKIQDITPKELIDGGYISDIHITQHQLEYANKEFVDDTYIKCTEYSLSEFVEVQNPKNPKRKMKVLLENPEFLIRNVKELPMGVKMLKDTFANNKEEYIKRLKKLVTLSTAANSLHIEHMMVHFMESRVNYLIEEILPICKNNTVVFVHHTDYLNYLYDKVSKEYDDRHVYKISGATKPKDREFIKDEFKKYNDCILIASYACIGTGLTISNLCHGVLFESFVSDTINMQSIGRGLGLSDMKDKYDLHDVVDVFPTKKIFLQGKARRKLYDNEANQYEYKIIKRTLQ